MICGYDLSIINEQCSASSEKQITILRSGAALNFFFPDYCNKGYYTIQEVRD